ncbi:hypothetical protein BHE74_00033690 [Ensete ventricosum]|nr:hypothetical protein GW17_00047950 [Ensete ventricosum]RWW59374.1 hypothetical protein BHE74_00033690 [Ensete ventricosum]
MSQHDHMSPFPDYSGYSSAGYSGPRTAPRVAYGFTSPPIRRVSRLLLRYLVGHHYARLTSDVGLAMIVAG